MNMKQSDMYIYTPATTDITIRWKATDGYRPRKTQCFNKNGQSLEPKLPQVLKQ